MAAQTGMKELLVNEETSSVDVEMYLFQFECLCKGNGLNIEENDDQLEAHHHKYHLRCHIACSYITSTYGHKYGSNHIRLEHGLPL